MLFRKFLNRNQDWSWEEGLQEKCWYLEAKLINGYKQMMADLKEEFHQRREDAKGAWYRLKYTEKTVQAYNEGF